MIQTKLFRSNSTSLGIEINSSQFKLVEVDTTTRPTKILNFASVDIISPHADNTALQLKAIVEERGFKTRRANVVVSDPSIVYRLINLPPMSKEEMEVVIPRNVERLKVFPEEPVFDWRIIRDVEEKGIRKKETLITIAPSTVVNQKISLVEDAGLKHNLVTTIPLALLSLLKIRKNWKSETIAFLYLGIDKGYLVFIREGNWSFSREFLWGEEGFNEQQVLSEVIRSRHHLIKRIRGRDLDRVIVSGETGKGLHSIKENLRDNLAVKVELLEHSYGLDLTPIKGKIKEWENIFPGMVIALGLAIQYPYDNTINLIPPQIKKQKGEFKRKVQLRSVATIILLVLVVSCGWLYHSLGAHRKILQQNKASLKKLQPVINKNRVLGKQRDKYNKSLAFLEHLKSNGIPWMGILQQLSLIVPDEMVFHSIEAGKVEGKWQISIKGEVVGTDSFALQSIFNNFYSQIKNSTIFSQAGLVPMNINQFKEVKRRNRFDTTSIKEEEHNKTNFEIRLQMKEEK